MTKLSLLGDSLVRWLVVSSILQQGVPRLAKELQDADLDAPPKGGTIHYATSRMWNCHSRKGDCWDNAPIESFFGTLKNGSLHHYRFDTREQARRAVFEYIGGYL
jgi:transposase InsO family protein